jgi:hypothetical protein
VNRQVDYEEYRDICKAQFLQETRNPYFLWQNNFVDLDLASPTEELTPETFVTSDVSFNSHPL